MSGPGSGRLVSLDAFRGLTIAGMILVNNPGSWSWVFGPMRHAEWNGWTPTDLVFPFFLFIMGVALTYSLGRRRSEGADLAALRRRVYVRSAVIFGIGLFLNGFPAFDLSTIRIFGVLQRIALVYLAAGLITLHTGNRGRLAWSAGLLLGYWALLRFFPVPGYGAGDLSPEGNVGAFLDRLLFEGHLWRAGWDPEGILSTLPAVATGLAGVLTGEWLRRERPRTDTAAGLLGTGWLLILFGLAWDLLLPINKSLWTPSYVVFTAGAALEGLGLCWWLIEVRGRTAWSRPAVALGMNPLSVFVLSILVVKIMLRIRVPFGEGTTSLYAWVYRALFVPWAGRMGGSFLFAVAYLLIWTGVAEWMYRRRMFLRV